MGRLRPCSQSIKINHIRTLFTCPKIKHYSPSRLLLQPRALQDDGQIQLAYLSHWSDPHIHFATDDAGNWQTEGLKVRPSAGPWRFATVEGQSAEFVLTDNAGNWDKSDSGENYKVVGPGRYVLSHGRLHTPPIPPVLIVTDLDDTLVGDDEATAAFKDWWHSQGAPAQGRLVYNTGRSVELFQELLKEKAHCLPECDVLISSVGTKIYVREGGRWTEDDDYNKSLGQGWDLQAVRDACYAALVHVGKDNLHFRPPGEMNEFKVTCGVRTEILGDAVHTIQSSLDEQGVSYKVIVSGKGDWKYMDLVPRAAGKKAALNYVRTKLNFQTSHTVACGDSGNDIDMLEGGVDGEGSWWAIIVGNAQPDLREWVKSRVKTSQHLLTVEAHRAHGILQGLERLSFKQ